METQAPGMERFDSLRQLYVHELKDLLSAEDQILDALPEMARRATSPELAEAFETHRQETARQKRRLESILEELDETGNAIRCEGLRGLTREGEQIMEVPGPASVIDAALIALANRVEHYEIAAYSAARGFANALGLDDQAMILETTLEEEEAAEKVLSDIAIEINQRAAMR